ncbi:MAG: hypothetical protein MUC87_18935 [Bacteroidia bacterium]|jgi:hypothetical protein|nr:hypothetical protein [Bacteroidia bacterium]
MELQLINGHFHASEAGELLTELVNTKIRFHEKRIQQAGDNEEDIKMREKRIIELQRDLSNIRQYLRQETGAGNIRCTVQL